MTETNRNYVIRLGDGTYYGRVAWRGVPLAKATWLTHKKALRICNHLNQPRIDLKATVVERKDR